jgi:hypothetical protein
MALKSAKPGMSVRKPMPRVPSDRAQLAATQQDAEMRRLLREAAWSRMFGKAGGPKNPFAR